MIDYDFPQTVSVPEDSPSRADQYELALVVCQRNADTALQAYRRVDEKAEKFMTFTAVVAAAIFAAMTKDQARQQINVFKGNPEKYNALMKSDHPNHAAALSEWTQLRRIAEA